MPRKRIKRIAVAGQPSLRRLYGRPRRPARGAAPTHAERKAGAGAPAAAATPEGPGFLLRLWRDWREFLGWVWMGAPGLWRRPDERAQAERARAESVGTEELHPGDRLVPVARDTWWHQRPPNQRPRRWIKHWYQD